jgi:peroxiredoxin
LSETSVSGVLSFPLRPGDQAPDIVLDAAMRDGRIAFGGFAGRKPLLIGLFRGLLCPFCRRHLATQTQIDRTLREKGVEYLAVVNTPSERARLFFRHHPMPHLLAACDPERISHQAFGLRAREADGQMTERAQASCLGSSSSIAMASSDGLSPKHRMKDGLSFRDRVRMVEAVSHMVAWHCTDPRASVARGNDIGDLNDA